MDVESKVSQITTNIHFKRNISDFIRKTLNQRKMRPLPKPGMKYKRSVIDKCIEEKNFHVEYFLDNCMSVWKKESKLSRADRDLILFICNSALHKTIEDKKL